VVDYLALHMYVGNPSDNYYNYLSTPLVLEERTRVVKGLIDREMENADRGSRDPIYIAWDEYNSWYRARTDETMAGTRALEEHYNLEDALVIAGFLNAFIRNADIVKMANMAQMVNVIAPIFTNETGLFKQTIYYPLQLFAQNVHGTSLDLFVDCETYATGEFFIGLGESTTRQDKVPYLDVSASYFDGEVIINVVNRHKDKAIATDIISQSGNFTDDIRVVEVNGPDTKATNDFGKTMVETKSKSALKAKGNVLTYSFPPHSFTQLTAKIK
jgi:alpha-N-arabinofuranosidase